MNRVGHFLIPADDVERAGKFYSNLFGWEIVPGPDFGANYHRAITVEEDAEGRPKVPGAINGGLLQRGAVREQHPTVVIEVDSIERTFRQVSNAGGGVALQRTAVGDEGHYAEIKDTEENVIGLWEPAEPGARPPV